MSAAKEPNVSVGWNGVIYTAHASKGGKYGTGVGKTEDEARAAALKDLEKDPERKAPEIGGSHTTATVGLEEQRRAGKTGG